MLKQIGEPADRGESEPELSAERKEPVRTASEPAVSDRNAQLVLAALEQSRTGQGYRTVNGLAVQTRLPAAEVERVLNGYPHLVMRSRLPDTKGAALFKYRR